jgi:ubiquitin-like 1-activating enzyme E1 B
MSEDSENSEEIANLRKEAAALKKIRESVGKDDFAERIFEKVFSEDINRLLTMEEMWKSRKQPEPLTFGKVQDMANQSTISANISETDQRSWTLPENFTVFLDRYVYLFLLWLLLIECSTRRLSERLVEAQSKVAEGGAPPIISFDKDDVDTLDFVTAAANLRSHIFDIDLKSKFDTKRMFPVWQ